MRRSRSVARASSSSTSAETPLGSPALFDVWVVGPVERDDTNTRADLLKRLEATHAVAAVEGAQFMLGARLRLMRGVSREAADAAVGELQWLGARVEVAPHRADDGGMLALDQVDGGSAVDDAPWAPAAGAGGPALAALDEGPDANTQPITRAPATVPAAATISVAPPSLAAAPASAAGAAAVAPAPAAAADDDERFRPRSDVAPMELQLERPIAAPRAPTPAPAHADAHEEAPPRWDPDAETRPIEHGWQPVPGRLLDGRLRQNPAARIAVGIVLGLGLGWLLAQPYAGRAERRVAALRAEADRERYRPVEEARARTAALDQQADDAASQGALGTAVIWILVGGAAFAGWWRLS